MIAEKRNFFLLLFFFFSFSFFQWLTNGSSDARS